MVKMIVGRKETKITTTIQTTAATQTTAVTQATVAMTSHLVVFALQATLVSKLSLALNVQNTSIAGTDRYKVTQFHVHRVHSSMMAFSSAIGKTRFHARHL